MQTHRTWTDADTRAGMASLFLAVLTLIFGWAADSQRHPAGHVSPARQDRKDTTMGIDERQAAAVDLIRHRDITRELVHAGMEPTTTDMRACTEADNQYTLATGPRPRRGRRRR